MDALDAAKSSSACETLTELIGASGRIGRWHVVASVRAFELRHAPELREAFQGQPDGAFSSPELCNVRHVYVDALSDEEFHEWLQTHGITTLIYTGFATNLCILDSPCAMKAMSGLGYRCVLLREGTMAIEFPDQPPTQHTESAIRYVESWVGYSASAEDFLRA